MSKPLAPSALKVTHTPWTPAMDDRMCAMIETDQYSFGQIAELMGMTRHQVTSRFTKIRRSKGRQGE